MSSLTPRKTLSSSTFPETTIPYQTFVDHGRRLVAVANSFSTQWSGRDIPMWSKSLLLYDVDTLELKNFVDDLDYDVHDVAFHPNEKVIAIATGRYDGGAYFEGELLLWNYETSNVRSILTDVREVTKCGFNHAGDKLSFTVSPPDDLDSYDYTASQYEIMFPVGEKISLQNLTPVSVTNYVDQPGGEDSNADVVLANLSSQSKKVYTNRHLLWDIVFLDKNRVAVARNNSTVEIWDIESGNFSEIKLDDHGHCVEIFLNASRNSLLVNLWSRDFDSEHTNKLFSINLSDLTTRKIAVCSHTVSQSRENFFLARQTMHSSKTMKDFVLNPDYKIVFEQRLGHYDLFNHYIRIDNSDLLYYIVGTPPEQHESKALYSIDPHSFKTEKVWQLEKRPDHLLDLSGIKIDDNMIITGKVYSSPVPYASVTLFCIDLRSGKERWSRTVSSQVCSFGSLDNGGIVAIAMTNGQLELVETATGATTEILKRGESPSFARPLSIATMDNTMAVGLTNGQIEIYDWLGGGE